MASRADLFAYFDEHGINHETIDHPAFFTVEDGRAFKAQMPGGHSKNLFVKDKKGALFLAIAHCDTKVDLIGLGKTLGAKGRLSFGKPALMEEVLGVTPGSVTPFALINADPGRLKQVIIDKALFQWEKIWFHPLENTASTGIIPDDLLKFMETRGFKPSILDLSKPEVNSVG